MAVTTSSDDALGSALRNQGIGGAFSAEAEKARSNAAPYDPSQVVKPQPAWNQSPYDLLAEAQLKPLARRALAMRVSDALDETDVMKRLHSAMALQREIAQSAEEIRNAAEKLPYGTARSNITASADNISEAMALRAAAAALILSGEVSLDTDE